MKKTLFAIALAAPLLFVQIDAKAKSATSHVYIGKNEMNVSSEKTAIEKLIYTYQDALNASDLDKIMSLYKSDGVLMANAAPTAEGTDQVKGTYQYVFNSFTYTLKFTILEIEVNGNTATVRSTSKGSFLIKSNGQSVSDENRELFVFAKENGQWKIAKYMYNKTK